MRAEGSGIILAQALGSGGGPFIAIMLTGAFGGYGALFVFSAALSCASLLLLAVIKLPRVKQPERPKRRTRLSDLVQVGAIPITCVITLVFFCYSGVGSFVVGYAEAEQFATISVFFLVYSAVIVVLRPFAGRHVDRSAKTPSCTSRWHRSSSRSCSSRLPNGIVFLLAAAFLGVGVGVTQSVVQAVVARGARSRTGPGELDVHDGPRRGIGIRAHDTRRVLELLTYREMYLALSVVAAATVVIYYLVHGRKVVRQAR